MENVWREAQVGYAILLTPRNQDGKAPWVVLEDVTIRHNVVRHAGGGVSITGEDSNIPSGLDAARQGRGQPVLRHRRREVGRDRRVRADRRWARATSPSSTTPSSRTATSSPRSAAREDEPKTMRGFVFRDNLVAPQRVRGDRRRSRRSASLRSTRISLMRVFSVQPIAGGDARRYPKGNTFVWFGGVRGGFRRCGGGRLSPEAASRFRGTASDGKEWAQNVMAIAQLLGVRQR